MATAKALLALCVPDDAQQSALLARQQGSLTQWDNWLKPLTDGDGAGEDPAYDDDFQLMREEINKLSGTDSEKLNQLAEKILCYTARDLRVVTWYIFARLQLEGESGLCEGLQLLAAVLSRYGENCHPRRPNARKSALEWLNSTKIQDTLSLWPDATREQTSQTAAVLCLLETLLESWPESDRPSLDGLSRALEIRLAGSGGLDGLTPQGTGTAESTPVSTVRSSAPDIVVKSEGEFFSQSKVLSRWLADQQDGWLASHRLMKAVRWDTVGQIPALDASGRTRLSPPKPDYRAQLKRLYLQQSWTELVEQASTMFCEGGNRFWLDLQWYLWQGLTRAGQPWDGWADYILSDLKLLLGRLHGLEQLSWSDGTPFADEVTLTWIAEKVNDDMPGFGNEPAAVAGGEQTDDILALEAEAMEKGDSDGPEAALGWLQSRPGMESSRNRWLLRLLMARVAEQFGRNEMALHLLGELTSSAPQLTLNDWEPALLFEVQARRLKLLRLKAGRSESDKTRLAPEMDELLAGLIAIDPARAMVLCG
ncbi:type VI secretion system protein TssA [Enterobacter cloacae]|uniref:Type VI secretion system protein TssA n=1 Tax=Enterobacter cloacae TaxID=550 RepID=A0A2T4XXW6_ENTCL|nr:MULTISPECIES: type VI secretion system protein TssA [Enterobacter]MBM1021659.1 type VI secretion system protein TssA [Enterobacter sp. E1]MEA3563146.1 type VI secretion system protein TssA [Enterobacter sp. GM-22]MEA3596554.1 type VI secretion system protein TssA [Enterobacter sp. GM-31]PTM34771.1 type VI secretion system protein TssA [Enterobacter cloacae]TFF58028.1 type VI secretion system protein TssA [Enterobacter sp. A11]